MDLLGLGEISASPAGGLPSNLQLRGSGRALDVERWGQKTSYTLVSL